MDALELFTRAQLTNAVACAIDKVRSSPTDVGARWILCEMLCFTGDLERIDKHLDAIGQQDVAAAPAVALFRQLLRAEGARQQFYAEGRVPELLSEPTADLRLRLQAAVLLREGAASEAVKLLQEADAARVYAKGKCDGVGFKDLRDLDDCTASFLETLTSTGKYYWIPLDRIRTVELRAPVRVRDLFWRRARMVVDGGPDGEVFLPAIYPGSQSHSDERIRLGKVTDWSGGDGKPVRGAGQRMFLINDESRSIGDIHHIEMETD